MSEERTCRVREDADVFGARGMVRDLASSSGFPSRVVAELVIAASELCTNLLRHGGGGVLRASVNDETMTVRAEDEGPPFENFDETVARSSVDSGPPGPPRLQKGASLGRGLGAVLRFSDALWLEPGPPRKSIVFTRRVGKTARR